MAGTVQSWRPAAMLLLLAAVGGGCYLLYAGLYLDKRALPSALIGKPVPAELYALPALRLNPNAPVDGGPAIAADQLKGQAWLLSVWASWCASCAEEQPILEEISGAFGISIVGLNYKDDNDDARRWLVQYGNPFDHLIADSDGSASIELGVYGVPEIYVIDAGGLVRARVVGALTDPDRLAELRKAIKDHASG